MPTKAIDDSRVIPFAVASLTSGKWRVLEDKQNMSPNLSVIQHISGNSPGQEGTSSMLGNRQTLDKP
jgi:hypothetical protein